MKASEKALWDALDHTRLPRHVAVIMDGNGRWAKKRHLPRILGHREGVKTVDRIVTLATEIDLEYLTLYSFSTENWNRPPAEVDALMGILREFLLKEVNRMVENNIRFNTIGRLQDLPESARKIIDEVKEATAGNNGTVLTLALSYGSRNEMLDGIRSIAEKVKAGELEPSEINDEKVSASLYTADMPDVDLLIRTSGELRISNFLLWQIAYAELYFTDVFWPDFSNEEFLKALASYQSRERRFGLAGEQLREKG